MATAMTGGTAKLVLTKTTDGGNVVKLYVYYKTKSQSIEENQTVLSLGMYVTVEKGGSIGPWHDGTSGSYLGVTSSPPTFSGEIGSITSGSNYWIVSNKEFTITHETDGTGSATIYWKWNINSSWGNVITPSGNFTIALTTIPRKSGLSINSGNYINEKPTFTIDSKSTSFTHTLQYKYSDQTSYTTIVSKTKSTTYTSWVIPEAAYGRLTDIKQSDGTTKKGAKLSVKCITYNGSTKIGEVIKTLNAYSKGASNFSITGKYIEEQATINISKTSSGFVHKLKYSYDSGKSWEDLLDGKTTSSEEIGWAFPDSLYKQIREEKSIKIKVKCISYYKGDQIGEEKIKDITAYCKSSLCNPTVKGITIINSNPRVSGTDSETIFISGHNRLSLTCTPEDGIKNWATFETLTITCDGVTKTQKANDDGTATIEIDNIKKTAITIKITDSRGFYASKTITLGKNDFIDYKFLKYTAPQILLSASYFPDGDNSTNFNVVLGITGNYTSSINKKPNNLTVKYRYSVNSTSPSGDWTTIDQTNIITNNDNFSTKDSYFNITITNSTKYCYIQAQVTDSLLRETDTSNQKVVFSPLFDWSDEDFQFNIPVNLIGSKYGVDKETGERQYALNLNNSDIIGVNGIAFKDDSNAVHEGLLFARTKENEYDSLRINNGQLSITTNYTIGGTISDNQIYKLCYVPKDTMKIPDNTPFAGYISNARRSIFISIPIDKPLVGVTTAELSGKLEGRGITGYLYNPNCIVVDENENQKRSAVYDLSKGTVEKFTTTCYLANDDKSVIYSCIHFHITFDNEIATSSDPNSNAVILNNTPATIVPYGTLTITFG